MPKKNGLAFASVYEMARPTMTKTIRNNAEDCICE